MRKFPCNIFWLMQERPTTSQTMVWHTVGAPGRHETRKLFMRMWGAWHYNPVDYLTSKSFFPLDGTRVLALAPTHPGSGLHLTDRDQVERLLRRLSALAAVSYRTAIHPLISCSAVRQPNGQLVGVGPLQWCSVVIGNLARV